MNTATLTIPKAENDALDRKLKGLSGIDQSSILLSGMRAAGRAVRNRAMELAPVVTDRHYKRGPKASIKRAAAYKVKAFLRENEPVLEVRVKASKRAPHFHLVELGHRIVTRSGVDTGKRTRAQPFISTGGKYSQAAQKAELQAAMKRAIKKLIGA